MKKWVVIMLFLLMLSGCGKAEDRQLIRVNGELYVSTGLEMPVEIDPSSYLGTITSSVEPGMVPVEEGQSNFGGVGNIYARLGEDLAVIVNHEWVRFERE